MLTGRRRAEEVGPEGGIPYTNRNSQESVAKPLQGVRTKFTLISFNQKQGYKDSILVRDVPYKPTALSQR